MRAVSFGYNPCLQKRRDDEEEYTTEYDETEGGYGIAALYLSSQRIPTGLRITTPRRIVFQTRAADQGFASFGGEGTFGNSHTWFEASILKPWAGSGGHTIEADTALEEVFDGDNTWWDVSHARGDLRSNGWDFVEGENGRLTWKVCNNLTACATFRNYRVEWTRGVATEVEDERAVGRGEGFLKLLKPGYKVVLWARAEVGLRASRL